jgi:SPP1 gp7 family putative phage head morphogenesis protein
MMLIHKVENRLNEEEYADKYIEQLEKTVETIDNEIMKIFKKANDKGQWSNAEMAKYNRKEKLRKQIRGQIRQYKNSFISKYRDDLTQMYKEEALFTQDLLKDVPTLEISDQFDTLPTQAIKSEVVDSVNIKGKTMTEYISKYSTDLAFRIEQEVFESIALGENPNRTSRRLYGISDQMGKNRVDATTRSWMNAIFNQANLDVYKQGGLEKVRYLATLDARTCPVCSADHNRIMTIDEVIFLPRHPFCRCAYSPYINTELTGPATGYDEWLLDGRRSIEQLQTVLNRTKRYMRAGRIKKKEGQHLVGIIGAAMKKVS